MDIASHTESNLSESRPAAPGVQASAGSKSAADTTQAKRSPAYNAEAENPAFLAEKPWYEELLGVIAPDVASVWSAAL